MKNRIIHRIGLLGRIVFTYPLLLLVTIVVLTVMLGLPEYARDRKATEALTAERFSPETKLSRLFAISSHVRWLPDGTLHLMDITSKKNQRKVLDEKGTLVWEGRRDADDFPYDYLVFSARPRSGSSEMISPALYRQLAEVEPFAMVGDIPIQDPNNKRVRLETWRYDRTAQVFDRYASDGRYGGSLGANGFVESKNQARAFGAFRMGVPNWKFQHLDYWITDQQIYELNMSKRSVVALLPGGSSIVSLDHRGNGIGLHATTEDGMHHIISYDAKTRRANLHSLLIRDADGNKLNGFLARDRNEGGLYLYSRHGGQYDELKDGRHYEEVLYRVGADGRAEELNLLEWTYVKPPLSNPSPLFLRVIRMVSPTWFQLLPEPEHTRFPLVAREFRENGIVQSILQGADEFGGQSLVGWLLFSVVLLAIGIWTKGFHGWTTAGWMLFVLFFGFPALLTWVAIAPRTYVRCKACGKRTPIHRESCRCCEAAMPSEQTLLIHNPLEVHQ